MDKSERCVRCRRTLTPLAMLENNIGKTSYGGLYNHTVICLNFIQPKYIHIYEKEHQNNVAYLKNTNKHIYKRHDWIS